MSDETSNAVVASTTNEDADGDTEKKVWSRIDQILEEYRLSPFLNAMVKKFLREKIGDRANLKVERIRQWFITRLSGKTHCTPSDSLQLGCPEIIPGLRAFAWWDTTLLSWVQEMEQNFETIRDELLALKTQKGFRPYRGPSWASKIPAPDSVGSLSHDAGDWNVFYLFLHDAKFEENCEKCPVTVSLIEKVVPRHYHHAFFSALNPGTHVVHHNGPTNKKLRLHLPLTGLEGSRLRVGAETRTYEPGRVAVFDDSFDHEAWHDGDETRIVLIVDLWHPDLSDEEVKFLSLLQKSKLRAERLLSEQDESGDNFYSILEQTKDMLSDNEWWRVANGQLQ